MRILIPIKDQPKMVPRIKCHETFTEVEFVVLNPNTNTHYAVGENHEGKTITDIEVVYNACQYYIGLILEE